MTVRIIHGVNQDSLPLAGHTIHFVAENLRDVFNIPLTASALVNGEDSSPDHILLDGDQVEFVRTLGQKGGLPDYSSERELKQLFTAEELEQMREAGMKMQTRKVLPGHEVSQWQRWLADHKHLPTTTTHVVVDIEGESITVDGKQFHMKTNLAAITQCLLEADGEARTQKEMKVRFPRYIEEERVDNTINRNLKTHPSGIGKYIFPSHKGFMLILKKV